MKNLGLFVTLFLVFNVELLFAVDGVSPGSGTETSPYLIEDRADFDAFCTNSSYWSAGVYTCLETDLDLSGTIYDDSPVAQGSERMIIGFVGTPFFGVFDGKGHVIQNLVIDADGDKADYLGLFGVISGTSSCVKNLGFEGCNITGGYRMSSGIGSAWLGSVCGWNDSGTISNCYTEGVVITCRMSGYGLGGICGKNSSGKIFRCTAEGALFSGEDTSALGGVCGLNIESGLMESCFASMNISGSDLSYSLGGLCGENSFSSVINNCYANGTVSCGIYSYDVGGLCAVNDYGSQLNNCYAAGIVSNRLDTTRVGGLCARNDAGTVNGCFWDIQTSGQTNSAGGTGKTTVEMQTESTFTDAGWDFSGETVNGSNNYWAMDGYPVLTWHNERSAVSDLDGDGLPDWWEERYFSGATNANPKAICSNGINTMLQAYIAGLDPTDPSAYFKLYNLHNVLEWNVVAGRVYTIYWSTNLLDGFQLLETNYTGGAITDLLHGAESKCFYKIDVQLAE